MLILSVVLGAGCSTAERSAESPPDPVGAAEFLCPVMWTWVKDVGDVFNRASQAVGDIETAEARRQRWFAAFDEIDGLNAQLVVDVGPHRDDPILGPLVAEIERDVPLAGEELDDIRALFSESPEIDERRHQDRTAQVIVRIEKVIDLPKPSLARLDVDGTLTPAFQSVPTCQHSIRDVDDGRIQTND